MESDSRERRLVLRRKMYKESDNDRTESNIFLGGDVSTRKKAFD